MIKKLFLVTVLFAMVGIGYSATVKSDDYQIPIDNQGKLPADINLVGVDKHMIGGSTTGQVAKNASVTTAVSTTSANPCLLYGITVISTGSTYTSGYTPGSSYVVIRDTHVVNTSTDPSFVIMFSTAQSVSGAADGQTFTWTPPAPIKFNYGILGTNSGTGFQTTILFRYLKR